MRAAGLAEVEAAKADGRWAGAYESQAVAEVPAELAAALAENPRAGAAFEKLSRTERYQVMLGLLQARTGCGRAARVAAIVRDMAKRR